MLPYHSGRCGDPGSFPRVAENDGASDTKTIRKTKPGDLWQCQPGGSLQGLASSLQQAGEYHTRCPLLKRYPTAADLAAYDGQRRLGQLVHVDRVACFAFGVDDRLIGAFSTRKAALAALPGIGRAA